MLTAAAYFTATEPAETELRELAHALYCRVDWPWAQHNGAAVVHGWKPEGGFLHYGWEGYSEAILMYVLGLGQKEEPKDEGYLSGLSGMVTGSGGKTFNLDKVKGDLKEKACDFVLDHAKSLL